MEIEYEGKKAVCSKCKSELLIDEIEEINHEGYFWEFEEDGYVYRIRRV